jgi:hypothetical protein
MALVFFLTEELRLSVFSSTAVSFESEDWAIKY